MVKAAVSFFAPALVVTNLHVLTRATKALVRNVANGKVYAAVEIVGMNAKSDLCVIRIDDHSIPSLSLAPAGGTKVGDEVYVASNPEGLEGSITKGIVSSVRIDAGLLQIDAPISSGSSGGAVINRRGEVAGIVKSSLTEGQNLNFAVPVERLRSLSLNLSLPVVASGACAYRDRDRDRLRGLVRSVTEKERISHAGAKAFLPEIKIYDIDGNIVEFHAYGFKPEGGQITVALGVKQIISFDENRLLTHVTQFINRGDLFIKDSALERLESSRSASQVVEKETTFSFAEAVDQKIRNRQFSVVTRSENPVANKSYDSEGNMTEWLVGEIRAVFEYEPDGRIKESSTYERNSLTIKSRYLYEDDDHGNWIVRREEIMTEDGWQQNSVTYREITYFK